MLLVSNYYLDAKVNHLRKLNFSPKRQRCRECRLLAFDRFRWTNVLPSSWKVWSSNSHFTSIFVRPFMSIFYVDSDLTFVSTFLYNLFCRSFTSTLFVKLWSTYLFHLFCGVFLSTLLVELLSSFCTLLSTIFWRSLSITITTTQVFRFISQIKGLLEWNQFEN